MKIFSKVFLVAFISVACNNNKQEASPSPITAIEIDRLKLTTLTGDPIDLKQYKGKTVFVNFWATWCKPCIEEMPTILSAMDSLKDERIEFLFASDETAVQINEFEKEYNFQFHYVITNSPEDLGIVGLPTTFVFDKNGKQVFSEMGYRKWNDKSNLDLLTKIAKQE